MQGFLSIAKRKKMDSCLLNRSALWFCVVLLLLFADGATSQTRGPRKRLDPGKSSKGFTTATSSPTGPTPVEPVDLDKASKREKVYLRDGNSNTSVEGGAMKKVKRPSEFDRKDNESSLISTTDDILLVSNTNAPTNGSDSSSGDKEATVNLAIIPVLAGFFIVTFVCIKCCNRVKADVIKDRELYIEDGKPLFRVEPESHPDYLSSIGSGYNPYSTVTSGYNAYSTVGSEYIAYSTVQATGYNPYNTVTTMMSDVSTVSETKDAGTMVKPRDIWKTMRQARGSSVPDFSQDRNLLGTVAEEVKKFKNKDRPSPGMNSVMYPRSPRSSPRSQHSAGRSQSSTKIKMGKKPFRSADDLLDSKGVQRSVVKAEADKHSVVKAEVENHQESPHPTVEETLSEESQALLGAGDEGQSLISNHQASPKTSPPVVLVNGQYVWVKNDSQRPISQTSTCSSSEGPDGPGDRTPRSRLRSSGKTKALNVTFEDAVVDSKTNSPKTKSPCSSPMRPFSDKYVEIPRKPSSKCSNVRRKFSLTPVENDNSKPSTQAGPVKVSASTDTETDCRVRDRGNQNTAKEETNDLVKDLPCQEVIVEESKSPDDCHRELPSAHKGLSSTRPPTAKNTDSDVPNGVLASGIASANNTLVLPALSCH